MGNGDLRRLRGGKRIQRKRRADESDIAGCQVAQDRCIGVPATPWQLRAELHHLLPLRQKQRRPVRRRLFLRGIDALFRHRAALREQGARTLHVGLALPCGSRSGFHRRIALRQRGEIRNDAIAMNARRVARGMKRRNAKAQMRDVARRQNDDAAGDRLGVIHCPARKRGGRAKKRECDRENGTERRHRKPESEPRTFLPVAAR